MIAYGAKRRSGILNCVSISRLNPGQSKTCIGLEYVKCHLDAQCGELADMDVETVEEEIDHYFYCCHLLKVMLALMVIML